MSEGYRPEYRNALELIGRACAAMERQGHSLPVLVGGAVVEWYSTGAYMSGDFDLHVLAPEPFTDALLALGFRAEDRPGRLLRGFYHPDFDLGVEFISGRLLDGYAERARVRIIDIADGSFVPMLPPEDIIADRMGQYSANPRHGQDLLAQARMVYFLLAPQVDRDYLEKRLRHETAGEIGMAEFERLIADDPC